MKLDLKLILIALVAALPFYVVAMHGCIHADEPRVDTYPETPSPRVSATQFCLVKDTLCQANITEHGLRPECVEPAQIMRKDSCMYDPTPDGAACCITGVANQMGEGIGICNIAMCQRGCKQPWRMEVMLCGVQYDVAEPQVIDIPKEK